MKNLLLACTVMLGLQFCHPLMLKAGGQTQVAEMISLGVNDAECKVDVPTGLDLPTFQLIALVRDVRSDVPAERALTEPDRKCDPPLPTAGRFPSAP